jgi:hypothetical protein
MNEGERLSGGPINPAAPSANQRVEGQVRRYVRLPRRARELQLSYLGALAWRRLEREVARISRESVRSGAWER